MGVCNCSMFCCALLNVHSSIAIILMGKRKLIALLHLSFWCLMMVEWLFLGVPGGCLRFVIVVFPDHTHLLFFHVKWFTVSCYFKKKCTPLISVTVAIKEVVFTILYFIAPITAGIVTKLIDI